MRRVLDKHGNEIREGDVLKVFHFEGARRKKHYLYKSVTIVRDELYGLHLGKLTPGESKGYFLTWHNHGENQEDLEIVQAGYDPDRKLKGPAA